MARRHADIVALLGEVGLTDLSKQRILELGCGSGGVVNEFLTLGAAPANLVGVDLLFDRLRVAKSLLLDGLWVTANGQHLPFPAGSFDLELQFTAFSSILDPATRQDMASEMLRLLKPGGGILWYDFIWNPLNPQTEGLPLAQVKKLFPGTLLTPRRVTLVPPLARLLLPRFQPLANSLTCHKFLNSHLLIWIKKPS